MVAITTPVPSGTKLGENSGPGGALVAYMALVDATTGGTIATLPVSVAALPLPTGAATQGAQAALLAALQLVGTRVYGSPLARVAVGAADAGSAATTGTEVLLHASTRCFVKVGAAATNSDIPLEAGEKFHLRCPAGSVIHVIRDTADGFLNIIPVA